MTLVVNYLYDFQRKSYDSKGIKDHPKGIWVTIAKYFVVLRCEGPFAKLRLFRARQKGLKKSQKFPPGGASAGVFLTLF